MSTYPNSALSAGAMVAITLTAVVTLTIWLVAVYLAAREPGHDPRHHMAEHHGN